MTKDMAAVAIGREDQHRNRPRSKQAVLTEVKIRTGDREQRLARYEGDELYQAYLSKQREN